MLRTSIIAGAVMLTCAAILPAGAADTDLPYKGARPVVEHHIIEVAIRPPRGRQFIINGSMYTARTDACLGWEAGQRISLIEGNWHGWCGSVVFYNHTLRQSCEMSCGYF